MYIYRKAIMLAVFGVLIASSSMAGQTLKQFDGIKGRSYHADLYTSKSCDACHANKKPLTLPADDACLACHDLEALVKATARSEEDKWQNPHNNMHYGKDVPCMECHGEHSARKHMCAGCHSFDYPNFKE